MKILRVIQSSARWVISHLLQLSLIPSLFFAVFVVISKIPDTSIEVMAGVKGAYFETASKRVAAQIEKDEFEFNISNTDNSSDIIGEIINPSTKTEAGFVAQDLKGLDLSTVESYGVVVVRGMMLFAKGLPADSDIAAMAGRSVFMLPKGSASTQVCLRILDKYFPGGAKPQYVFAKSEPEAIDQYIRSASGAMCIFDDYQSKSIQQAALAPQSVLLSIPDALALAHDTGWLTTKKIPSGSYSTNPRLPDAELTTIGLPVQFFAKKNLHIGSKVAISRAIFSEFAAHDAIDDRTYPYFAEGSIPQSQRATSVYEGGLPWMYGMMSFKYAVVVDAIFSTYGVWFALLYFLTNLYMFLGFVTPADAFQRRRMRSNERFIGRMATMAEEGAEMSKKDKKHLERLRSSLGRSIVSETQVVASINTILNEVNKPLSPHE